MIEGPIDATRDGTENQQRVEDIRAAVAARCDARTPFLLLPIRVETRFQKAELPSAGDPPSLSELTSRIEAAAATLATVAARPFATRLGTAPRRAVRALEIGHYAFLDETLATLANLRTETTALVRDGMGSLDALGALTSACERLSTSLDAAIGHVRTLRSSFQAASYANKLIALRDQALQPVIADVEAFVEPRVRLMSSLAVVAPQELTARVARVQELVRSATSTARTRIASIWSAIQRELAGTRRIYKGTSRQLAAVRAAWVELAGALDAFARSDGLRLAPERVALERSVETARREVALAADSRAAHVLSSGDLARGAAASHRIAKLLDQASHEVATEVPAPALIAEAAIAVAGRITALAGEIAALAATVPVLPAALHEAHTTMHGRIASAFARWSTILAELADHGGPLGVRAEETLRAVNKALQAQASALERIRSDARDVTMIVTEATHTVDQLWVRFYPDDLAIETHQERLTSDEADDGRAFWTATLAAGSDAALQRAAWRGLVDRHGARRSAYIAEQLDSGRESPALVATPVWLTALRTLQRRIEDVANAPGWFLSDPERRLARVAKAASDARAALANATATPEQRTQAEATLGSVRARVGELGDRLRARARFLPDADRHRAALARIVELVATLAELVSAIPPAASAAVTAPTFPSLPLAESTWSSPPMCRLLPDRFVVVALRGGRVQHVVASELVPELAAGPDPTADAADSFRVDEAGHLRVPEAMRWMTDFDEAVAKGMGVRVTLSSEDVQHGFDELLVIGVRSGDAEAQRSEIERLLRNHHYNEQGLSFLAIGTPTNNTEAAAAGFRSDADTDADASYAQERSAGLFDANAQDTDKADGLRFASALGISPAVVQHVAGAAGQDASRSVLVNRALWPATGGAFCEDFLGTLMSTDTLVRLEQFFLSSVSGRGFVPAFRVGNQPYGVLTTTAFSRFVSVAGQLPVMPAEGPDALADADKAQRFEILLVELLGQMRQDWSAIRSRRVRHAHSDSGGDPQRHFIELLGLHATGVEHAYRFALNVATRPKVAFGYSPGGPASLLQHLQTFFERAFAIPHGAVIEGGLITDAFEQLHERLSEERVYDVRILDRLHTVRGPLVGADHAGDVNELLAATADALVSAGVQGRGRSHAVLYMLLRQALLVRLRRAALTIAEREGLLDPPTRRRLDTADEFAARSLEGPSFTSRWSYLFARLRELDRRVGLEFPRGPGTLYEYLGTQVDGRRLADYLSARGDNALYAGYAGHVRHDNERSGLQAHAATVRQLATIPKDALESLVREHLDLCAYRFDAWQLGLATRRLDLMRAQASTGIYIGAFGWVENLRPGGERTLATGLPPELIADGEPPVFAAADDQGFIHAPSIAQAVTAAILRSGHLSESDRPDLENRMAVNLSSRRVREALAILDGIVGGHDLGALLGYRFERELHEAYAREGRTFDDLIAGFRAAFPGAVAVMDDSAASLAASRLVTDGLRLLDTVRGWIDANISAAGRRDRTVYDVLVDEGRYTGYPWGLVGAGGARVLPRLDDSADVLRLPGVLRAIDRLADVMDALADLSLTESVYQIVRGNFPRAAAVMTALAEGRAIPRPTVVDTPRTGTAVTHRIVLALPRIDGRTISSATNPDPGALELARNAALPAGWKHIPMSPRANAEPGVNRWLGELLGDPATIWCRYSDAGGDIHAFSIDELALQPIDLLALLGQGIDTVEAELSARILKHTLPLEGLADSLPREPIDIRVLRDDTTGGTSGRSLFEISVLLIGVSDMLNGARATDGDDLTFRETAVAAGAGSVRGIDLDELRSRLDEVQSRLRALAQDLMQQLADGPVADDPLAVDAEAFLEAHRADLGDDRAIVDRYHELAELLFRAAHFGVRGALPPVRLESVSSVAQAFVTALDAAFVQIIAKLQRAAATIAGATDSGGLLQAARELFGPGARVVPQFVAPEASSLANELGSDTILRNGGPLAVDRFLHGAASVRGRLGQYMRLLALADAFGYSELEPAVAQLPAKQDDFWLGAELPADYVPSSNKLSVLVLERERWSLDEPVEALLLDEWSEVIPNATETSAVTFFYDQPDATPPQSVLLVVPPGLGDKWTWDDLVHALHDTFDLARSRTVELDHLADQVYGQLLPAITGELVPDRFDGAPVTGHRVILDFHQSNG